MTDVNTSSIKEVISLSKIRRDGGTQPRAALNQETIGEYAEAMKDGAQFPPVIVFFDGQTYWLADGFHRIEAASQIGDEIEARVFQGTQRDAVLFSVGVNATHGLRRSSEDKRRAVTKLLTDPEWVQWSDRKIAKQCSVSHVLVGDMRRDLTGRTSSDERLYTTKHGTEATMQTAPINADREKPTVTDDDRARIRAALADGELHRAVLEQRSLLSSRAFAGTIQVMQDAGEILRDGLIYRLSDLAETTPVSRDANHLHTWLLDMGGFVSSADATAGCRFTTDQFIRAVNLLGATQRIERKAVGGHVLIAAVREVADEPQGDESAPDRDNMTWNGTTFVDAIEQRAWYTADGKRLVWIGRVETDKHHPWRANIYWRNPMTDTDITFSAPGISRLEAFRAARHLAERTIFLATRTVAPLAAAEVINDALIDAAPTSPLGEERAPALESIAPATEYGDVYRPFKETVEGYREWKNNNNTLRVYLYRKPGETIWQVGLSLRSRDEGRGLGGAGTTPLEALRDARRRLGNYFPSFVLSYGTPEVLRLIKKIQDIGQTQRLLATEKDWKKRKTVIAALEQRLESDLKAAPDAVPAETPEITNLIITALRYTSHPELTAKEINDVIENDLNAERLPSAVLSKTVDDLIDRGVLIARRQPGRMRSVALVKMPDIAAPFAGPDSDPETAALLAGLLSDQTDTAEDSAAPIPAQESARDGDDQLSEWRPAHDTTREAILARAARFTVATLKAFWHGQDWEPTALHLEMERGGLIEFVYKWSSGSRWWIGYTLPTTPSTTPVEDNSVDTLETVLIKAASAIDLALGVPAPDWSTIDPARRDELIALLCQAEDAAAALLERIEETWWPREAPVEAVDAA